MHSKITFLNLRGLSSIRLVILLIAGFFGISANAQTTITTTSPATSAQECVTFNFQNNNAGAIVVTNIGGILNLATGTADVAVYAKPSAINGAPGAISAANGWNQIGAATVTTNGLGTIQPLTTTNVTIPAGATYGICVRAVDGAGTGVITYNNALTGVSTVTGGGAAFITGTNIGYAGLLTGPTNTPRYFCGSVTFTAGTPCAGTPAPGATVSSVSGSCTGVNFLLSTATPPVAGTTGVSYQWQSSATGAAGSFTNIAGATNATYTATQTVATYYQAVVTCAGGGAAISTPILVGLSSNCYCAAGSTNTSTAFEKIANVTFADISQASTSFLGYENFVSVTANVIAGGTYPITITGNGNTYAGDVAAVWIDFNNNGSFTDAGEQVYVSAPGAGPYTGNVVIPANAAIGNTRMRIRLYDSVFGTGNNTPCGNNSFGQVEDYTVNIAPCVSVQIAADPTDKSTVCGGTTSFTVGTTGSFPAYQWQYRTSATGTWLVVPNAAPYSGVNTATLTIAGPSSAMSGYQYRASVSGACAGATPSAGATLTVTPFVASVNPASANICFNSGTIVPISITNAGGTATSTFTNATAVAIPDGTGAPASSPITVSGIPAGAVITKIAVTLNNITHTYVGDLDINLKAPGTTSILNLVGGLDNGSGSNATANFTGTTISSDGTVALSGFAAPRTGSSFKADGLLGYGANGQTATISSFAPFLALPTLNGVWTLVAGDFATGDAGTINSWSIAITYGAAASGTFTASPNTPNTMFTDAAATIPYTGTAVNTIYVNPNASTVYTVNVNTSTCQGTTTVAVNVNTPVSGNPVVANQATCAGTDATLAATGITGGTGLTYQWQISTPTAPTFVDIAGATSATYVVTTPTTAQNGNQYRVKITSAGCAATTTLTSTAGTLTVNPTPVVVISAAPSTSVIPGSTVTLTAATSPNAAASYQWFNNGVAVAGATSNTLVVGVDGVGSYTVKVTDVNGCSNTALASTPASIAVTAAQTAELFIYPSPNTGKFQVRYFNDLNDGTNGPAILNVYDSKGSRVFTRRYVLGAGYQSMQVDLASHGKGVYRVDLLNTSGERLKTGNVLVY